MIFLGVIFVLLLGFIIWGILSHKFDLLINFLLRMVTGLVGIYLLNLLCNYMGLEFMVGTNSCTALVAGVLGVPGVVLLYGVSAYLYYI